MATFLLLAYTTIVTVNAPVIAQDLHAGFGTAQWIIDIYTLGLAALVLALGSASDRIGHRRLFLIGLATFGVASTVCATAGSGEQLVAARGVQSLGGAALFAATVPLLTQHYPGPARATAFAIWGAVAAMGSTVGTIAGGAVTEFISWRWLFLGAVPLCLAAAAIAASALSKAPPIPVRVDVLGAVLLTAAMSASTFAVIHAGECGWTSTGTVIAAMTGVLSTCFFLASARRTRLPLLPPSMFGTKGFTGVLIAGFAYYFAAFATLPVLSHWLQSTHSMTPLNAALVLTTQLVAFLVVSLAFSARLHHAPRHWVLGGGTILTGLGCLPGAVLLLRPDWTILVAGLVITGVGAAIVSPILPAVAATSVLPERAGTAAGAANAARQLGLTIGIALCGTISGSSRTVDGPPTTGVAVAFIASAVVGMCGGAVSMVLLRGERTDRISAGDQSRRGLRPSSVSEPRLGQ